MIQPSVVQGFVAATCRRALRRRPRQRRGVTIVVVLGLISITLALSYAMIRAQGSAVQIQMNGHRLGDARQAAISGLMAALSKMHRADWAGVDSTLTGRIGRHETYEVQFSAGDSALTTTHADYADWPYRVSLLATGYCTGDQSVGGVSMHQVRAVVRLSPRQLSTTPPDWSAMQQYTLYQWQEADLEVDLPCRIEGPVWMQGRLSLCPDYPTDSGAESQYLSDLNAMRVAGRGDYRPFSDTIHWRNQHWKTEAQINDELGLPTATAPSHTSSDWSAPSNFTTYKLYAGGPSYTIPRLGETLEGVTLRPDPKTNPLGIVFREGAVELRDNVSIAGLLISTVDVFVSGRNVQLKAVDLPALADTSEPVRLQAVWAGDDFRVYPQAGGRLEGMASVRDEFEVQQGPETMEFNLVGRLVTKGFLVRGRNEWDFSSDLWEDYYDAFRWQLQLPEHLRKPYFPEFMAAFGRKPLPRITLKPDTQTRRWHWTNLTEPIYVPASGDPGLRWDLIDWTDSPQNAANS